MSPRTVDWSAERPTPPEGLRERKKRLLRQQLSDTATELFLERGFDAVRVSEVAAACGVSEKTVYNYFPTKESLVLDRWDGTMIALRSGLADPAVTPVEAAVKILSDELRALTSWLTAQDDPATAARQVQQFGALIRTTPSLRAHQRDVTDQLIAAAADVLTVRTRRKPDDPEPLIAATALLGLWQVQATSLTRHLVTQATPAKVARAVTKDVARAASVLNDGLQSLDQPRRRGRPSAVTT
ncbi:TetR/AcrR family transcriptional regulator [Acidothermaceae bacterium B102]|nr:TetR/AcrR family transcriptional regulator [Acidothermaceae bacterium B102]